MGIDRLITYLTLLHKMFNYFDRDETNRRELQMNLIALSDLRLITELQMKLNDQMSESIINYIIIIIKLLLSYYYHYIRLETKSCRILPLIYITKYDMICF